MTPINERDLPLLELLAAAPERLIPAEKVEPLALILMAKGLLQTGEHLRYSEPNGHPPAAPQLREAFRSAADYRCVFLSHDAFGLTQNGGLYLQDLGVSVTDEESALVAELIERDTADLFQQAQELLRP